MGTNYSLQAEVAIASKLLSGKCGVDMLKVTLFFLFCLVWAVSGIWLRCMWTCSEVFLFGLQNSEACSLPSITAKIKRRWG